MWLLRRFHKDEIQVIEESKLDATLMSILLVYLHGKLGEGMSNQMRMTKSMGINYSVNWWK